tara:strand:+ start:30 stop:2201 length:2172 start_codon:yes stop_codon:yes gene_type:complete
VVERSYKYLSEVPIAVIKNIKGIGKESPVALSSSKYNIKSILDLFTFYPPDYWDRSTFKKINEINENDMEKEITLFLKIDKITQFRTKSRLKIVTFYLSDESGQIKAMYFGNQYRENQFKDYKTDDSQKFVAISGKPDIKKNGKVEFKNPKIESSTNLKSFVETGGLIPRYPLFKNLDKRENQSKKKFRKIMREMLNTLDEETDIHTPGLLDYLSPELIEEFSLIGRQESIKKIHFPKNNEDLKNARRRLALDEFVYLRTIFESLKLKYKNENNGFKYDFSDSSIQSFVKQLPFELTKAQVKTLDEILCDLRESYPMKRLLQGEVGSGKTVVASIASYAALQSGYQVAFMAPTEVLAEQHYLSISQFMNQSKFDVLLLTSSIKDRTKILNNLQDGRPALFVGTHALIQESIKFSNLGLAIIDEQQRFGVEQRKKLINESGIIPDQLIMSATPIPRTTALSLYGDLEISTIDELPPGRKEIKSYLFGGLKKDNEEIYDICKSHLDNNSQVFVVCPFIQESEVMDIQAAENVFKEYEEKFKNNKVSLLHGRMSFEEKEKIMNDMKEGKIDILVSTVVIEVGIDITNATLMILESAERFGLNQLHQLRGRVGRGDKQSECIFHITKKKTLSTISEDGKKRLEAIVEIKDGFKLSEVDLEIRGQGKVTGTAQSGQSDLKIADLRHDYELLLESQKIFDKIKSKDTKKLIFEEAKILFPNYFQAEGTT